MEMHRVASVIEISAAPGSGHDRARVLERGDELVIALADGAGGTGNGGAAAQAIVDAACAVEGVEHDGCELLSALDRDRLRLRQGQSTAVILAVRDGHVSGASAGDSGAWLVLGAEVLELTDGQVRKPLVGDGCVPVGVRPARLERGTLLVASDGLFRYAKRADIVRIANGSDLGTAARALVDLVRLPNGTLQDDVAVVLCRERPR